MTALSNDLLAVVRRRAADPATSLDMADDVTSTPRAPATQATLARAEERLGFALPTGIRQLYTEVGDGGFGPGYGLLGLLTAVDHHADWQTLVGLYEGYRRPDPEDPSWSWPERTVPLCYWGCIVYTAVDCSTPAGRLVGFDEGGWALDDRSLTAWLEDWLAGDMMQPVAPA
jgi:hypothetical protein